MSCAAEEKIICARKKVKEIEMELCGVGLVWYIPSYIAEVGLRMLGFRTRIRGLWSLREFGGLFQEVGIPWRAVREGRVLVLLMDWWDLRRRFEALCSLDILRNCWILFRRVHRLLP